MGNRAITEYLLGRGAPLNICVAAMMGMKESVAGFLDGDTALANARGGHGIPLMFHAAMSGDVDIAALLREHGCREGFSGALHGAIEFGHGTMVEWLLNNGAENVNAPDFTGKTPLQVAQKRGLTAIADLLRAHGAAE
jgi:ankyrin repeat protein